MAVLAGHEALLVTGDRDPEGLKWALETALARLDGDPDAMAATPLRCRNGAWERLRLPTEHPAAGLLGQLEARGVTPEPHPRPSAKDGHVRAACVGDALPTGFFSYPLHSMLQPGTNLPRW